MNDNDDKYLKAIEKLATGYEYEETQTLIEETTTGTKKKVIRYKKHMAPNFQAATYLLKRKNAQNFKNTVQSDEKIHNETPKNVQKFKVERF